MQENVIHDGFSAHSRYAGVYWTSFHFHGIVPCVTHLILLNAVRQELRMEFFLLSVKKAVSY